MMTSLISILECILLLIETLENRIELVTNELNTYLVTIPGIGPPLTTDILAVIDDVKRFFSPSQIISYADLHSSVKQSGYSDSSDNQHITKIGNRHYVEHYTLLLKRQQLVTPNFKPTTRKATRGQAPSCCHYRYCS